MYHRQYRTYTSDGQVRRAEAGCLRRAQGKHPGDYADIIFLDPPYHQEYDRRVLELLRDAACADENTLIVVETALDTSFDYAESLGFAVTKEKKYKTNKHVFIQKSV